MQLVHCVWSPLSAEHKERTGQESRYSDSFSVCGTINWIQFLTWRHETITSHRALLCNQEQSTKHSGEQVPELCASAAEDTFVIVYVSVTTDDYLPSRERRRGCKGCRPLTLAQEEQGVLGRPMKGIMESAATPQKTITFTFPVFFFFFVVETNLLNTLCGGFCAAPPTRPRRVGYYGE